jgi:hypothetical protein
MYKGVGSGGKTKCIKRNEMYVVVGSGGENKKNSGTPT